MLSKELLSALQEFIDNHTFIPRFEVSESAFILDSLPRTNEKSIEMKDFVESNKKPAFCRVLFNHIDSKGLNDAELYKKAGIDRRHFSKIRSNPNYHPSKSTAIALALALELEHKDAVKLIKTAGYALSESEVSDLVITFCFKNKIYDIVDVNLALDYFNQKPLAGVSD